MTVLSLILACSALVISGWTVIMARRAGKAAEETVRLQGETVRLRAERLRRVGEMVDRLPDPPDRGELEHWHSPGAFCTPACPAYQHRTP